VSYLEVGSRIDADRAFYPDDDLMFIDDANGKVTFAYKDGNPY